MLNSLIFGKFLHHDMSLFSPSSTTSTIPGFIVEYEYVGAQNIKGGSSLSCSGPLFRTTYANGYCYNSLSGAAQNQSVGFLYVDTNALSGNVTYKQQFWFGVYDCPANTPPSFFKTFTVPGKCDASLTNIVTTSGTTSGLAFYVFSLTAPVSFGYTITNFESVACPQSSFATSTSVAVDTCLRNPPCYDAVNCPSAQPGFPTLTYTCGPNGIIQTFFNSSTCSSSANTSTVFIPNKNCSEVTFEAAPIPSLEPSVTYQSKVCGVNLPAAGSSPPASSTTAAISSAGIFGIATFLFLFCLATGTIIYNRQYLFTCGKAAESGTPVEQSVVMPPYSSKHDF